MSAQQYTIANLSRATIVLGRQLDNRVRRIVFDVTSWLQEYPEGTITLYVIPHEGDGYPAKIDMDNGKAIWTILESDTAYSGRGMAQLQLIGKNGEKMHSANANTLIEPSAAANAGSTPPNAAKPWFDDVKERLKRIEEAGGVTDEQVAGAIESYLEKNPDAAGAKIDDAQAGEKTTFSGKHIDELLNAQKEAIDDKLDADKLPTAINTALTQAKESGEFKGDPGEPGKDGKDGDPGPAGADGKDYVLTDEDKKEIAEMIEVHGGGGSSDWVELISGAEYTVAEDGFTYFDTELEGLDGAKEIIFIYTWMPDAEKNAENGNTSGNNHYMELTLGDWKKDLGGFTYSGTSLYYGYVHSDVTISNDTSCSTSGVSMQYNRAQLGKDHGFLIARAPVKGNTFSFKNRLHQKIAGTFTLIRLYVKY